MSERRSQPTFMGVVRPDNAVRNLPIKRAVMLRVNVGLSRKLSHDYNSTGFSVHLDGEVAIALDDPELALTKIRELFDLADEALQDQVQNYRPDRSVPTDTVNRRNPGQSTNRIAEHDRQKNSSSNRLPATQQRDATSKPTRKPANGAEPATNKQVQFILNLSKRLGMNKAQLDGRIGSLVGRVAGPYDLTKSEACELLDELTTEAEPAGAR